MTQWLKVDASCPSCRRPAEVTTTPPMQSIFRQLPPDTLVESVVCGQRIHGTTRCGTPFVITAGAFARARRGAVRAPRLDTFARRLL